MSIVLVEGQQVLVVNESFVKALYYLIRDR